MSDQPQQPPDPGGYQPMPPLRGGGYGTPQKQVPAKTPLILAIIGIVCWFVFSPAAIVLGLIAQNQYRKLGQRDTLAKVAWIGGIVVLALGIILVVLHGHGAHTTG
jgi:hypothetical protein